MIFKGLKISDWAPAPGILLSAVLMSCWQPHQEAHEWRVAQFAPLPRAYVFTNAPEIAWLQPLQNTEWRTVEQAPYMRAADLTLGLYLDGRAWAMPWWVMKNHHAANLMAATQPILITFCEVCSGGSAFIPVIDGKRYMYRARGLYNGTHFIADDETDSFWKPFVGDCFWGALKGSRLERLPLHHSTWAEWLALHPDTLVADGENESRQGHGRNFKPGNPGLAEEFARTLEQSNDRRLATNALVVGLDVNGCSRAYPLSVLDKSGRVVNDTLGQEEIVIVRKPGSMLTSVLSRRHDKKVLVFEAAENGDMLDVMSGSHWNYEGEAYSGPLAGKRLAYVPWTIEEWYVWAANHPETDLFGGAGLRVSGKKAKTCE